MNTKNTIANALAEHIAKSDVLSRMEVTKNGSLQTFVQNMVAGSTTNMECGTSPNEIFNTLNEFERMTKDPTYTGMLHAYDRIADKFAEKLSKAYENLKTVHETVTRLTADIQNETRNRIAADPVLAATETDIHSNVKLKPVLWDLIRDVSVPGTITKVLNDSNIHEELTKDNTHRIHLWAVNCLPFANKEHEVELNPLHLHKKKACAMIQAVCHRLKNVLSPEITRTCVAHILNMSHDKGVKAVVAIRNFVNGENLDRINDMLNMIRVYNLVIPQMTADVMDVAASTQAEIDKRRDIMQRYIDMTAMMCNHYRCETWKDAILVPGMQVNQDNWREFCETDKKPIQANPHLALLQYKTRVYADSAIPVSGILMENVVKSCDKISKEAYEEASSHIMQCNARKKDIFRDVFCEIVNRWIADSGAYSFERMASGEPKRYVAAVYNSNQDDAVENMLYRIILDVKYRDTLEMKIQNGLRDEYKKLVLSAESIDERDSLNVDQKVIATIVSNFLVDLILV